MADTEKVEVERRQGETDADYNSRVEEAKREAAIE